MGEAHHLAPSERVALIHAAREALDEASLTQVPIIAGTGAGSTRQTIQLTRDAYDAGADYAIIIASGFFAGVLRNDRQALKDFWADVARTSPLPIFIYNCKLILSFLFSFRSHNQSLSLSLSLLVFFKTLALLLVLIYKPTSWKSSRLSTPTSWASN
jgi:hypothetical protein